MDDEQIRLIMQSALEQMQLQLQAELGPRYYMSQYAVQGIRHTLYNELKTLENHHVCKGCQTRH